jgi:hypothetical protein
MHLTGGQSRAVVWFVQSLTRNGSTDYEFSFDTIPPTYFERDKEATRVFNGFDHEPLNTLV